MKNNNNFKQAVISPTSCTFSQPRLSHLKRWQNIVSTLQEYNFSKIILCWVLTWIVLSYSSATFGAQVYIIIEGVNKTLQDNILAFLSIEKEKNSPELTESRVQRLLLRAKKEVKLALEPYGYYSPQVEIQFKPQDSEWRIYIKINPGEPVRIKSVEIHISGDGQTERAIQNARTDFPLHAGDILVHRSYEEGKFALLKSALSLGFLEAEFAQAQLLINPDINSADIILHFDTKARFFFGEITFSPVPINDSLLHRYVQFKPGDAYTSNAILELQQALEASDYFAEVDVLPRRDQAVNQRIPVEIQLQMNKPNKYDFGLGYGTDTGIRGKVGWNRRIIGTKGHKFYVDATLSEIKSEFRSSYEIPFGNPRIDKIELAGGYRNRSTDTSDSIARTITINRRTVRGNWRENLALQAERTTFNVSSQSGTTILLSPRINWTYVKSDNFQFPRRGTKIGLDLVLASDRITSDISLARVQLNGKFVYALGNYGRILLRGSAGTMSVSDFSQLPPDYRFFAGGDNSIRGYKYESLGPTDDAGGVIGGHNLVESSFEYDYSITTNWLAAVFMDIGNAFDNIEEPFERGTGMGIRLKLPIGMVRADYAMALSNPDRPWRIHITIGPDL